MITYYSLSGFKSFRHESNFRLAPITLVYGGNSSGKSTIVQSILLLKQSLEASGSTTTPLLFGSKKYADLGNFNNVVSDHENTGQIRISISSSPLDLGLRRVTKRILEALKTFRLDLVVGSDLLGTPILSELNLVDDEGVIAYYSPSQRSLSERENRNYSNRKRTSRLRSLDFPATFFDLSEVNDNHSFINTLFREYSERVPRIIKILSDALDNPEYLKAMAFAFVDATDSSATLDEVQHESIAAAVRERHTQLTAYTFKRFVLDLHDYNKDQSLVINRFLPAAGFSRRTELLRGFALDHRLEWMLERSDFTIYDLSSFFQIVGNSIAAELSAMAYIGPLRDYPERNYIYTGTADETVGSRGENFPALLFADTRRRDELNRLGKVLGLEYAIDIYKSRDVELNNVFALRLTDATTGANVGLSDVGFGISQVLPILMECTARNDSTILIEQPEIHLNPKLQAALGQVFASAIDGNDRQFIIETHSEHLLLRIQRLIREGKLKPSDVAVLYVSKHKAGSAVLEIPLAENGDRLIDWPDGFFDDTYRELFDSSLLR